MSSLCVSKVSTHFLAAIPRQFARRHAIVSQGSDGEAEVLACPDDVNHDAMFNCGVRLERPWSRVTHEREALLAVIDAAYEAHAGGSTLDSLSASLQQDEEALAVDLDTLLHEAERDLLRADGKAMVVQLVDQLLLQAVRQGASDLHIQPSADRVVVRLRIDGVLDAGHAVPNHVHRALVSRIKVMGGMDVAERLVPQDGRCSVRLGSHAIDLRISTIPTAYGERTVLRLLDNARQPCTFDSLGMPRAVATAFRAAAHRNSGIILVTGPTGSGKTTTLYAALRELDSHERNIMTIEDPIEYELDSLGLAISQSQVNEKKGITFATGLRHILRQDPDIIMVGEIRDAETARIAIQSSLTGHLVFSTLHTNDAPSAATRLIDLGVEPYLIGASLSCVLAQRLVRRACTACQGAGCEACGATGYRGRIGVFELMPVTEDLREAISHGAALAQVRRLAVAGGMRTLLEVGEDLIAQGTTTRTEVERVIHA
jgi:general secretion pathway protein E